MCQYSVFYGEYENEKKTGQKNLTFPDGDLNPGFLNKFPPKIWILREIRSIELTVLKKSWLYKADIRSFQNNYVYLMTGVIRIVGVVALFLDSDKSKSWLFVTAVNDTVEEVLFNNFWMQFFSWCNLILGTLRLHIEHFFQFSGISVLWWELIWAM